MTKKTMAWEEVAETVRSSGQPRPRSDSLWNAVVNLVKRHRVIFTLTPVTFLLVLKSVFDDTHTLLTWKSSVNTADSPRLTSQFPFDSEDAPNSLKRSE